jgi:hypothetical protein
MPARKNLPKRKKARGFTTMQLKLSSRYKSVAITPLTNCSFAGIEYVEQGGEL